MRRIMLDEFQRHVMRKYQERINELSRQLQIVQSEMNTFAATCVEYAGGDLSENWEPIVKDGEIIGLRQIPKQQGDV